MRILIIANSRSGKGRAARAAEHARDFLTSPEGGSHTVRILVGGPGSNSEEIYLAAADSDTLVVAGGDGSIHHAAPVAVKCDIPLYHLPCGNENLFAREFGMTRRPSQLAAAIAAWKLVNVDLGRYVARTPDRSESREGHFVLMASCGPDASVVHRLAHSRTSASGHLAYAGPVAHELLRPHFPKLRIIVDGRTLIDNQRGIVIVANCRRYALGIDPCHRASMADGLLDCIFMPCSTRTGALRWGLRCRRRVAERLGAVGGRGRTIQVLADGIPCQIDGEAAPFMLHELELSVNPASLPCLTSALSRLNKMPIDPPSRDRATAELVR